MNTYTEYMRHEAVAANISINEAVEKLRQEVKVRTVQEVLEEACALPESDAKGLQKYVVDRLMEIMPSVKRDSVERKVRMWFKDKQQSVSKASAIQLCFALKLSYSDSVALLYKLCGEGFHWRDPEEIVFLYSLLQGKTYAHACELSKTLHEKGLMTLEETERTDIMTDEVRSLVKDIRSDEELEAFFRKNRAKLGTLHNTAYLHMKEFLALLRQPAEDDRLLMEKDADAESFLAQVKDAEKHRRPAYDDYYNYRSEEPCDTESHFISAEEMSVRDVLSTYLYDKVVYGAESAKGDETKITALSFDLVKSEIRRLWPEETGLSKIDNRKKDVTRKLLVLLFLATDGDSSEYQELLYDKEPTAQEISEDRISRMDTMLKDCGFSPLDPRSPFDWMILYCLCAEDILEIDDRLRSFLTALFS